jgi:hypothetical protein
MGFRLFKKLVSNTKFMRVSSETGKWSKLAQVVMFLTCIQEVPGSYIVQDTDYTDQRFSWFS